MNSQNLINDNNFELISRFPKQETPFLNKCLANRNSLLQERIVFRHWKELERMINEYSPDIIILLSRKMPRIYQLLQLNLKSVVSDFAIAFVHNKLYGKKVAVVDDAVNAGTTLNNVCDRLNACGITEIKRFAIAKKQGNMQNNISFVRDNKGEYLIWNDEKYRQSSLNTSLALFLQNLPFELEFPVFCTTCSTNYDFEKFGSKLKDLDSSFYVHYLDALESVDTGLYRYSVDIFPDKTENTKWRFYLDECGRKIIFVPMINYNPNNENTSFLPNVWKEADNLFGTESYLYKGFETFPGEARNRLQLYMASLEWAYRSWPALANILSLDKIELREEDTALLFGSDFANLICSEYKKLPEITISNSSFFPSQSSICESKRTKSFCEVIEECPEIKEKFESVYQKVENSSDGENYCSYFIEFFKTLGEITGENNIDDYMIVNNEYNPNKSDVSTTPYLRLRVGPTFEDILLIMKKYWSKISPEITPRDLHIKVSEILDQQIDQGFIVPVLGMTGQRIFRKGEPRPFNRNIRLALLYMGILTYPEDNILEIINGLPDDKRRFLHGIIKEYDSMI